jgi:hypothetical protein
MGAFGETRKFPRGQHGKMRDRDELKLHRRDNRKRRESGKPEDLVNRRARSGDSRQLGD